MQASYKLKARRAITNQLANVFRKNHKLLKGLSHKEVTEEIGNYCRVDDVLTEYEGELEFMPRNINTMLLNRNVSKRAQGGFNAHLKYDDLKAHKILPTEAEALEWVRGVKIEYIENWLERNMLKQPLLRKRLEVFKNAE